MEAMLHQKARKSPPRSPPFDLEQSPPIWLTNNKKTAGKKFKRAVRSIDDWCKANRHKPVKHQHAKLCQKVRGHYAYYGVTGNSRALGKFLDLVRKSWRKSLHRRNTKRGMPWDRYNAMLGGPYALPAPRILRRSNPQTHFVF
jgi:hypothetical protein